MKILLTAILSVSLTLNVVTFAPGMFQASSYMPVNLPIKASKGDVDFPKVLKEAQAMSNGFVKVGQ